MLRAFIVGLALFLAGCSEESMRSMSDKEDMVISEQLIRDVQTGNQANVSKFLLPEIQKGFIDGMPQFKALLPSDPKAKLTMTGTNTKKSVEYQGASIDAAQLTYMVGVEKDDAVVRIEIHNDGKKRQVVGFEINPTDEEDGENSET